MSLKSREVAEARVLVGPTASGKSRVAQWLAEREGWVVLSADSMLVYRGMNIGTAKPTPAERSRVTYFGVDVVRPDQSFSTGLFLQEASRAVRFCREQGRDLLIAGGTGLYVKALLQGLDVKGADPAKRAYWRERLEREGLASMQKILQHRWPRHWQALADPDNPRRCIRALEKAEAGEPAEKQSYDALSPVVGLWCEPERLKERIRARAEEMLQRGLVEETENLYAEGIEFSATAAQAIGYAEARDLSLGQMGRDAALDRICLRTRRLAKRQRTWFRHQVKVDWVAVDEWTSVEHVAGAVTERWEKNGPSTILLPGSRGEAG